MQNRRRQQMGTAKADASGKTPFCSRVFRETCAGNAPDEQSDFIGEFREGVDVSDTPVIGAEQEVRQNMRELIWRKGKRIATRDPCHKKARHENVRPEKDRQFALGKTERAKSQRNRRREKGQNENTEKNLVFHGFPLWVT